MPDSAEPNPLSDERVTFENWETNGCHIFVGSKHVLTLSTPESSKCDEAYRAYIEDWISPDEYCAHLSAVLIALGASPAVLATVENERRHYRDYPIEPPTRSTDDLLREVEMSSRFGTSL